MQDKRREEFQKGMIQQRRIRSIVRFKTVGRYVTIDRSSTQKIKQGMLMSDVQRIRMKERRETQLLSPAVVTWWVMGMGLLKYNRQD